MFQNDGTEPENNAKSSDNSISSIPRVDKAISTNKSHSGLQYGPCHNRESETSIHFTGTFDKLWVLFFRFFNFCVCLWFSMVRLKVILNSFVNNCSNLYRHFCKRNVVILIKFIESQPIHDSILIKKGDVAKIFRITLKVFMPDKYLFYVQYCFSLLEVENICSRIKRLFHENICSRIKRLFHFLSPSIH